ncbi:ATP-dependent protease ATPase subunit HslU [Mogibacterium diversum]
MNNDIKTMTPKQIVAELDKYIIGQDEAKKSVAIALRNRYRRSQLSEEMREEITPKNILMMGPTGVGKTEIARRLAKIMEAPFVKVEATKFTEVGYVGRDVDSMVRDLVEASVRITKQQRINEKYGIADELVEEKIIDALVPGSSSDSVKNVNGPNPFDFFLNNSNYPSQKKQYEEQQNLEKQSIPEDLAMAKEQVKIHLREGKLEDQLIDIEVDDSVNTNQLDMQNEGIGIAIGNIFGDMMPKKTKHKKVTVREARKILREQEAQNLIDMDQVIDDAIENAEQNGIIFIDEIDKIASGSSMASGADVSREGVQRDILPIVEGSVVNTKHGPVKTDHMLFIGAGAFHVSKPSDLIPELQGRFPINVELKNLDKEDFKKILTATENAVTKQQKALLETEGVEVEFTDDSTDEIAEMAYLMNEQTENIGARRLYTILEKLLEDVSFMLPDNYVERIVIDREFVKNKFKETVKEVDVDKYIL